MCVSTFHEKKINFKKMLKQKFTTTTEQQQQEIRIQTKTQEEEEATTYIHA